MKNQSYYDNANENCSINTVVLDHEKKTYTVAGKGIPEQTISFDEWEEWNSIKDEHGEYVFDCHIDNDEGVQFQYVNLDVYGDKLLQVGSDYRIVKVEEINIPKKVK